MTKKVHQRTIYSGNFLNTVQSGGREACCRASYCSFLGVASLVGGPAVTPRMGTLERTGASRRTDGSRHRPRSIACWSSKGIQRQGLSGVSALDSPRLTVVASLLTLALDAEGSLGGRRSSSESSEGRESDPDQERRLR